MKTLYCLFFVFINFYVFGQNIHSVQLFNPKTNDNTPVIRSGEQLILRFDDLDNKSHVYKYTIKHYDRNWQDDGLFFSEYATGNPIGLIDNIQYSFNTTQSYTNYTLNFPNDDIHPKISGNFEIIVYKDNPQKPIFSRRFYVVENSISMELKLNRYESNKNLNQRIEIQVIAGNENIDKNLNGAQLNVIQNNNPQIGVFNQKPTSVLGNKLLFQQFDLIFPGNSEFFYFNNKYFNQPIDTVMDIQNINGKHYTILYPVWAQPLNYQHMPDVNGAFYFRSNFLGIERDPNKESDYSWVVFSLDSYEIKDKEIYVVGQFNDYQLTEENKMYYNPETEKYQASIYLKQGLYNYILVTKDTQGKVNYGEINGNFWQTENLYQAFLYYIPFGKNYDGLIGYGELRKTH